PRALSAPRGLEREEARGAHPPRSRGRARQGDRRAVRDPGLDGADAALLCAQRAVRRAGRRAEPAGGDGGAHGPAPGPAPARPPELGGGGHPMKAHRGASPNRKACPSRKASPSRKACPSPKTAALLAYAEGVLSAKGRARV